MDYVTLLQKHAIEKENRPYLVLRDRKITYGQAYEDVRGFITPDWKKQFPAGYKNDLPEAAEEKLVTQNRIGFVLEEKENGWTLRQGYSPKEGAAGTKAGETDTGETAPRPEKMQKAAETVSGFVPAPVPYQNACMGVLSSGSTDVPKVMYRTYESWAGFIPEQNRRFCIDGAAVVFLEGSFSFTGNLSIWASVIYEGCTLAVSDVFNCRQWLEMIRDLRVSVLYLVPAKLKVLTKYLKQEYPSMQMVLAGSQLLGAKTAERLKRSFPNSDILLYYGASELDYITWLGYDEVLRFPDSVGKPVPGVKVWVENGLIYIDTPYHVEGLQQPCTLHDTGYFNREGYLIFNGREGDILNKGGFKISCTKIENALCALPEVSRLSCCRMMTRGGDRRLLLLWSVKMKTGRNRTCGCACGIP